MRLSAADQKVVDAVATHGWSCMQVEAGEGEPAFSYSVGWWESIASPEAIVFGLPQQLHHSMLWELFRQVQAGLRLADGVRVSNLIEGYECVARRVHPDQITEYFGLALWYQRLKQGNSFPLAACQLFWPGKQQGLFPWEGGCDLFVREHQPLLYLPRVVGIA